MNGSQDKVTQKQIVQISLPAKVTGIVFWGMMLVGLVAASFILSQREDVLKASYDSHIVRIEHELERLFVIEAEHILDKPYMLLQVQALFLTLSQSHPLEALHFSFAGQDYHMGTIQGQQEYTEGRFLVRPMPESKAQSITLGVYMKGLANQIEDMRKQTLLLIGSLVFMFGLVLQRILQKVLSRPILDMVVSTQKFNQGDQGARFNENRKDEFGYLAKFVNQALDSLLHQQEELETSRKALFEEKMHAEVTLHSIMDGVITANAQHQVLYLNPVAERLLGLRLDQALGMDLGDVLCLVHEDSGDYIVLPTLTSLEQKRAEMLENHAALVRSDGKAIPIEATAAPMRSDEGDVIGVVMVFQDVSQERKLSRQLSYQASHDMLTGLYNRRMFEEQVEYSLMNLRSDNHHHALIYMDLDQFKIVNDTCGHVAGDELLRQLGELLKGCIREGDTLARLGGDEFGLLLENCGLSKAARVADKIRQSVKDFRFVWQDKTFEIGVSIGVTGISTDNMDLANILASADMACYAAKDMGRNRVHVYEPSDAVLAERHGQMHWAGRITRALEEQRMVLFEQPVIGVSAEVKGNRHCEVLIRMKDESNSIVRPDVFIPAAERYNLMIKVDRWVIQQVFKNLSATSCSGLDHVVAINLSGVSLADDGLLQYVLDEAQQYQIDFGRICFEVTETSAISNLSRATHFIKSLKSQGCRFSLDDFGSGLSSFTYLKNLPVDYLKIDGSFVVDMLNDPIDKAMVEAIVKIGHVMKMKVIAEWVENQETLNLLEEMGVDYVQGYHLGVPKEVKLKAEYDST